MSYFNKDLPEWNNEGTPPPQSKKNEGWNAGDKPPAQWFNWLFNKAYEALIEIRNVLTGHIDNKNNPHEVDKEQVGLGNVTNDKQIPLIQKGQPEGVATLDNSGNVPEGQLGNIDVSGQILDHELKERPHIINDLDNMRLVRYGLKIENARLNIVYEEVE